MSTDAPYPFAEAFEVALARQIVADPNLLRRVATYLKPARINHPAVRLIVDCALRIYERLGVVPSSVMVLQEVRGRVEKGEHKLDAVTDCAAVFERAEEQPPADSKFVQEKIAGEERRSAVWGALDQSFKLWKAGRLDDIQEAVTKANAIGRVDTGTGIDLEVGLDARTAHRLSGKTPPRWGTGIVDLDDVLAGGLGAGELGCVLGAPKFGKSNALSYFALHAMGLGGTVVYVTLEMSEQMIADRMDAAIARIPVNDVAQGRRADEVAGAVKSWLERVGGACLIKYMPPRRTSSRDIRAYLGELRAEKGIVPSLLVVDSGDHLSSASRDFEKRYEEFGLVYTELRDIAVDHAVPVWTASWANREALTQKTVTMAQTAGSFQKVAACDVQVAICRTEEERQDKLVRFFVAACRYSTDGVTVGPFPTAFEVGRIVADGTAGAVPKEDE